MKFKWIKNTSNIMDTQTHTGIKYKTHTTPANYDKCKNQIKENHPDPKWMDWESLTVFTCTVSSWWRRISFETTKHDLIHDCKIQCHYRLKKKKKKKKTLWNKFPNTKRRKTHKFLFIFHLHIASQKWWKVQSLGKYIKQQSGFFSRTIIFTV